MADQETRPIEPSECALFLFDVYQVTHSIKKIAKEADKQRDRLSRGALDGMAVACLDLLGSLQTALNSHEPRKNDCLPEISDVFSRHEHDLANLARQLERVNVTEVDQDTGEARSTLRPDVFPALARNAGEILREVDDTLSGAEPNGETSPEVRRVFEQGLRGAA